MLTVCKSDYERELFSCAETIRDFKEYFHYYNHFCNLHSNKHCREKFPENNEMQAEDSESKEGPSALFVAVPVGVQSSGLLFVLLMASG